MREKVPRAVARLLREHESFVICGHVRPDADCVGSELALARALVRMGRRVEVWLPDRVPANCRFLPGSGAVRPPRPSADGFDAVVVLDTPRPERTGGAAAAVRGAARTANIDHHPSNERWAGVNWVEQGAAATAELVFLILQELGARIDAGIATCLYAGLTTDTGRFSYGNTTPFTHRLAAELLDRGVDPEAVSDRLYAQNRPEKLRLLAPVLGTLRVELSGALAWVRIGREMFARSGAVPEDTEGFVNCARDIAGVKVAVLLEEQADGRGMRVSLRSRDGRIDVNRIAAAYGGGGHRAAAGALIRGAPGKIERMVLGDVRKALRKLPGDGRHPRRAKAGRDDVA